MLVHPQFDPVAIAIGPLAVRWYGLMYMAAFILFVILGRAHARRRPELGWNPQQIDDLLFYGVLGVILGGRLGYVLFYKPAYYLAHPAEILAVWQGGMAFHGGFLGVLVAMWVFGRRTQRPWLAVTDFIAPLVPLGLAAGRLGNFINGELVGRATDLPWAMVFPQVDGPAPPPLAALPVCAGRRQPVPDPVVVFGQTAAPRADLCRLPDRLRRLPLHRRIRPRAGRLPRPADLRHVDGPVAVAADDPGRHRHGGLGGETAGLKSWPGRPRPGRAAGSD
jgi:hypothetical protein